MALLGISVSLGVLTGYGTDTLFEVCGSVLASWVCVYELGLHYGKGAVHSVLLYALSWTLWGLVPVFKWTAQVFVYVLLTWVCVVEFGLHYGSGAVRSACLLRSHEMRDHSSPLRLRGRTGVHSRTGGHRSNRPFTAPVFYGLCSRSVSLGQDRRRNPCPVSPVDFGGRLTTIAQISGEFLAHVVLSSCTSA